MMAMGMGTGEVGNGFGVLFAARTPESERLGFTILILRRSAATKRHSIWTISYESDYGWDVL